MKSKFLFQFFFLSYSLFYGNVSFAEEVIQFETDVWCPYTCDPKVIGLKGYVIDIAEEIYKENNIKFISTVAPWARTLVKTEKGEIDALGAAYKEGREDKYLFPKEDFGKSINGFFVNKNSNWIFKTPESLKDLILGSTLGYVYGGHIDLLRKNVKKLVETGGETAFQKNLDKLVHNELDSVIEETAVAKYTIKMLELGSKIKEAGTIGQKTGIYIAFTKNKPTSQKYVKMLEEGIVKYRKNGKFEQIMKKYGLKMEK
ncbi:transporter substrate-binding domain-containing protein [Pigmentibacter sp. JX0631]|uniref:substrate-binding periplasmic protein n=1 Tax=Pigmentibacter sp. JX0631 TaxID=2976982 RepID=UPI002468D9F4|nr:transporter substrate-binding domain-containing protein [Pigmentibacter sp. JX0631]WGL60049.1 transporter substrate-binding domain-containing protein [Pigmentibacter sp. JX0631]